MDELEKDIRNIEDANREEIERQAKIAAALPPELKYCEHCGRQTSELTMAEGDAVADDEYIEMMSIEPETIGRVTYCCGKCIRKGPPLP